MPVNNCVSLSSLTSFNLLYVRTSLSDLFFLFVLYQVIICEYFTEEVWVLKIVDKETGRRLFSIAYGFSIRRGFFKMGIVILVWI